MKIFCKSTCYTVFKITPDVFFSFGPPWSSTGSQGVTQFYTVLDQQTKTKIIKLF